VTVLIGYRLAGQGCVIAVDGRASEANGRVVTDTCVKTAVLGSCIVAVCGSDGRALQDLTEAGARNYAHLVEYVRSRQQEESHWGLVVYDRHADRLISLDSDMGEYEYPRVATAGCGGQLAAGALAAMQTPKTLEAAVRTARRAIQITCKLSSACGGKITILLARGKRGAVESF
jgi:ATP-dependent protease HslVU (ClpYQ) peptidase subunit